MTWYSPLTKSTQTLAKRVATALLTCACVVGCPAQVAWAAESSDGEICSAAAKNRCICGAINVNAATEVELMLLPRIGEKKANAIMELRAQRKGFTHVNQLLRVRGIGRATLRMLRPHLRLSGDSTLRESRECPTPADAGL